MKVKDSQIGIRLARQTLVVEMIGLVYPIFFRRLLCLSFSTLLVKLIFTALYTTELKGTV
jgi:hypothetical protein